MRLVIIESPFAGDVKRNIAYARACVRDAILRGEYPIASHLLFTQPGILDDKKPEERAKGIDAGLAWGMHANATVVYVDLGLSPGMELGIRHAVNSRRCVQFRRLGGVWSK